MLREARLTIHCAPIWYSYVWIVVLTFKLVQDMAQHHIASIDAVINDPINPRKHRYCMFTCTYVGLGIIIIAYYYSILTSYWKKLKFKISRDWLAYKSKETSSKMLQKNDQAVKSKETGFEDYLLK